MKSTTQTALGIEAWIAAQVGVNHYPTAPESISQALPLVIVEIKVDVKSEGGRFVERGQFQQFSVRERRVEALLLCTQQPAWTASQTLYGYVDTLADAIDRDSTLGGAVDMVSPQYEANYEPAEVEFADGTVARQATFTMYVGDRLRTT